jgi:hypothetical protein
LVKDAKPIERLIDVATQSMEHARAATDNYFSWLERVISASSSTGVKFNKELMHFAQQNIAVTFEYVQKANEATDLQDLIRIQNEFIQDQLAFLGKQASDFVQTSLKATEVTAKKPVNKSS